MFIENNTIRWFEFLFLKRSSIIRTFEVRKNVKEKNLIICFNTQCERRNVFEAKSLHTFDERSCSSSGLHSLAKAHTSLEGTEDNNYLFGQNILLNEVQVTFVISRTHCRV